MFETLKNVFRVKENERKLLYLIWMIFIHPYRLPDSGTGS